MYIGRGVGTSGAQLVTSSRSKSLSLEGINLILI